VYHFDTNLVAHALWTTTDLLYCKQCLEQRFSISIENRDASMWKTVKSLCIDLCYRIGVSPTSIINGATRFVPTPTNQEPYMTTATATPPAPPAATPAPAPEQPKTTESLMSPMGGFDSAKTLAMGFLKRSNPDVPIAQLGQCFVSATDLMTYLQEMERLFASTLFNTPDLPPRDSAAVMTRYTQRRQIYEELRKTNFGMKAS
jgi:hypothetical protein